MAAGGSTEVGKPLPHLFDEGGRAFDPPEVIEFIAREVDVGYSRPAHLGQKVRDGPFG